MAQIPPLPLDLHSLPSLFLPFFLPCFWLLLLFSFQDLQPNTPWQEGWEEMGLGHRWVAQTSHG